MAKFIKDKNNYYIRIENLRQNFVRIKNSCMSGKFNCAFSIQDVVSG